MQHDAGDIVLHMMERHDTTVLWAGKTSPGYSLIGKLFRDFDIELVIMPANPGMPMLVTIVELLH